MLKDDYQDILTAARPIMDRKAMDIPHRAKQFAPFAALSGFEDCVRKKELLYEPKRELSEDAQAELNFRMRMLQYGMLISVTYFKPSGFIKEKGQYETCTGKVISVGENQEILLEGQRIAFEDVYQIRGDGLEAEETDW